MRAKVTKKVLSGAVLVLSLTYRRLMRDKTAVMRLWLILNLNLPLQIQIILWSMRAI